MLSRRLSNTLDADFCVQALEATIQDYGCPQIMNTDQGIQLKGAPSPCVELTPPHRISPEDLPYEEAIPEDPRPEKMFPKKPR